MSRNGSRESAGHTTGLVVDPGAVGRLPRLRTLPSKVLRSLVEGIQLDCDSGWRRDYRRVRRHGDDAMVAATIAATIA